MEVTVRFMEIEDYEKCYHLWLTIQGFAIRSLDDSKQGIERFLKRNPEMSVVAQQDGEIVGSILCGHDGRRGCFYHVCVNPEYRNQGIGNKMTDLALSAMKREEISKVSLVAFEYNKLGNSFWQDLGWIRRNDLNHYEYTLNCDNVVTINEGGH